MKQLMIMLGLLFGLSAATLTAQAGTYQFSGHPVTIKQAGMHLTVTGYNILDSPTPAYESFDVNEVAKFLIVHAKISLVSSYRDEEVIYGSQFNLFSGPNDKNILSKRDHIKKLMSKYHNLLTIDADNFKLKSGQSRQIELGFVVYPGNDYILDADIGFSDRHNYVVLKRVMTTNGVTAD